MKESVECRREIAVEEYQAFSGKRWWVKVGPQMFSVTKEELVTLGELIEKAKGRA